MLKDNTLTFDNAYKEAVAEELAAKCSIEFNGLIVGGGRIGGGGGAGVNGTSTTNQVDSVNLVQTLGRKKHSANKGTVSSGNAFNSKKSCYCCSGNHHRQKCKYINERCHWGNKTGHIARMCRAKQNSRHNSVAHVSDGDESDDDETLTLHGVYSADADTNDVSGCKGISVKVTLGCEIVPMQLDTGAAVSIIPGATYRKDLSKYPLQASNIALKSCTGDAIPLAGKVYIPVSTENNGSRCQSWWHVVSDQLCSEETGCRRSSWSG